MRTLNYHKSEIIESINLQKKSIIEQTIECPECRMIIMFALMEPLREGDSEDSSSGEKVDIRQITLTLGWSRLKPIERWADAGFKRDKWDNSVYCPQPFPSNIPTLAVYDDLRDKLKDALDAVGKNRATKGQKLLIDTASKNLLTATKQIMTVWQNKADSDVIHAVLIAGDGGFDYTSQSSRGPRKGALVKTTEPGKLKGTLPGRGERQWQSTADEGVTTKAEDPTRGGVIYLTGLISEKKYGLRGRKVLSGGRYGVWSDWMWESAP
jgi:hypothetical protein